MNYRVVVIVVVVTFVTAAATLFAQNGNTPQVRDTVCAEEVPQQLLREINQERIDENLLPLVFNAGLCSIVDDHLEDLRTRAGDNPGELTRRSDGTTVTEWMTDANYEEYPNGDRVSRLFVWVTRNTPPQDITALLLGENRPPDAATFPRGVYSHLFREVGIAYRRVDQMDGTTRYFYVFLFASRPNYFPIVLLEYPLTPGEPVQLLPMIDPVVETPEIGLLIHTERAFPQGQPGGVLGNITYLRFALDANDELDCPEGDQAPLDEGWVRYSYAEVVPFTAAGSIGQRTIYVQLCDGAQNSVIMEKTFSYNGPDSVTEPDADEETALAAETQTAQAGVTNTAESARAGAENATATAQAENEETALAAETQTAQAENEEATVVALAATETALVPTADLSQTAQAATAAFETQVQIGVEQSLTEIAERNASPTPTLPSPSPTNTPTPTPTVDPALQTQSADATIQAEVDARLTQLAQTRAAQTQAAQTQAAQETASASPRITVEVITPTPTPTPSPTLTPTQIVPMSRATTTSPLPTSVLVDTATPSESVGGDFVPFEEIRLYWNDEFMVVYNASEDAIPLSVFDQMHFSVPGETVEFSGEVWRESLILSDSNVRQLRPERCLVAFQLGREGAAPDDDEIETVYWDCNLEFGATAQAGLSESQMVWFPAHEEFEVYYTERWIGTCATDAMPEGCVLPQNSVP